MHSRRPLPPATPAAERLEHVVRRDTRRAPALHPVAYDVGELGGHGMLWRVHTHSQLGFLGARGNLLNSYRPIATKLGWSERGSHGATTAPSKRSDPDERGGGNSSRCTTTRSWAAASRPCGFFGVPVVRMTWRCVGARGGVHRGAHHGTVIHAMTVALCELRLPPGLRCGHCVRQHADALGAAEAVGGGLLPARVPVGLLPPVPDPVGRQRARHHRLHRAVRVGRSGQCDVVRRAARVHRRGDRERLAAGARLGESRRRAAGDARRRLRWAVCVVWRVVLHVLLLQLDLHDDPVRRTRDGAHLGLQSKGLPLLDQGGLPLFGLRAPQHLRLRPGPHLPDKYRRGLRLHRGHTCGLRRRRAARARVLRDRAAEREGERGRACRPWSRCAARSPTGRTSSTWRSSSRSPSSA